MDQALKQLSHREMPDDPPRPPPPIPPPGVQRRSGPVTRGTFLSVQVNTNDFGQNILGDAANEPSIAIDPTNPNRIVIGWRQFDSVTSNFRQAGWAFSHDGGVNWTFPGVIQPGVFRSDPVLGADPDGNFIYNSLTVVNGLFLIDIFKSVDGGMTWQPGVPAFGGDKAWMAIDQTNGIGRGNIYCEWSIFASCCGSNHFTRSTDGGATWLTPIAISQNPLFGTLSVGSAGELFIIGASPFNFSTIFLAKSSDAQNPAAGPSFDFVTPVNLGGSLRLSAGPNPEGLLGQVWVAADPRTGVAGTNVYALASVNPHNADPLDVMFARSTDGGATWNAPVRVNDDPPGNVAWQWFGTLSVAPNGRIDAVWNDTRTRETVNLSELFYSFSIDAGDTWSPNVPLTPVFNSTVGFPNQNKIGDYYHMISDNGGANLAYAATFNDEQDVYFLRIVEPDCNANGVHDVTDVLSGTSSDCNNNSIPDECEPGCSITFSLPNEVPETIASDHSTDVEIDIVGNEIVVETDSPTLHFRYNGGDFQTAPLTLLQNNRYLATLPPANCDDRPEFFFSAVGDTIGIQTFPSNAPIIVLSAPAGEFQSVSGGFTDDFETDMGWQVSGLTLGGGEWERSIPADHGQGDPPTDFDRSSRAFLTDNAPAAGVSGGPTILTSPPFAATDCQRIFYAYWLNDTPDAPLGDEDTMIVEVATDPDGTDWRQVRSYNTALPFWRTDSIIVGAETPPSDTIRIRFLTSDRPPGNVVEAGIDAIRVVRLQCDQMTLCCAPSFVDDDGDNICNNIDDCPNTSLGAPVDADGCSVLDDDGDGVMNDRDLCPQTPTCAVPVLSDGCPQDSDNDGVVDGCDNCPFVINPNQEDENENGVGDGCESILAFERCPSDLTIPNSPALGVIVFFDLPNAGQDSNDVIIFADPPPGSIFMLGSTLVKITATDLSGKSIVCTFNVTLESSPASASVLPPVVETDCGCGNGMGVMMMTPFMMLGYGMFRRKRRIP